MKRVNIRICAAVAVLLFAAAAQAADKYYIGTGGDLKASTAANWLDGTVPVDGDTVVLDANAANSNLTWDIDVTLAGWRQSDYTGTVTFRTGLPYEGFALNGVDGEVDHGVAAKVLKVTGDVTLESGTWTHLVHGKTPFSKTHERCLNGLGVYRLQVEVGGNMTIGADAKLSADMKGLSYNYGPGSTRNTDLSYGASHGGTGYAGNPTYGSAYHPLTQGSGQCTWFSSPAGGVVRLAVGGNLTLDGTVSANGTTQSNHYVPSGGSVYITAGSLSGSGAIAANGSPGTSGSGPGGGGRIAVYLTDEGAGFDGFTGSIKAASGSLTDSNCSCGTVYRETAADGHGKGELIIDNNGVMSARARFASVTSEDGECDFSRVVLTNGARLGVLPGAVFNVREVVRHSSSKSAITLAGGTVTLPRGYCMTNCNYSLITEGSSLLFREGEEGEKTLTICSGSEFAVNRHLDFDGSLVVASGGKLSHESNATYGWSTPETMVSLDMKITGDLIVETGGLVDAIGRGYRLKEGPGAPVEYPGSGSHGGLGALAVSTTYGSIRHPVTHGSGGHGSSGGGAVKLEVLGNLTLDGRIDADALKYSGGGISSGAGGSIWILAGSLAGSGQIRACGGMGAKNVGGGGRIAVTLTGEGETFDGYDGEIIAYAGHTQYTAAYGTIYTPQAGAGTIYLRKGGEGEFDGTLVIKNRDSSSTASAYISDQVTQAEVGNVVVSNKAVLCVGNNATLKISGDLLNHGVVTGEVATVDATAGVYRFIDAEKTSVVSGTNSFSVLEITDPGKTLKFGAGDGNLVRILPGGVFFVNGAEDALVGLYGTSDTLLWPLTVMEGAKSDISYADVSLSDASSGSAVVAIASEGVDGGSVNWRFVSAIVPGERNVWAGEESSAWANAGNWSLGRLPVATDTVVIGAGAAFWPELSENYVFADLVVEEGARLDLNSWSITVSNDISVAGVIAVSGGETLTAFGDVSLAAVEGEDLSLVLDGEAAQSVNAGGNRFKAVDIAKPSGSVAFSGGFDAGRFRCAPAGLVSLVLVFSPDGDYKTLDVDIAGVSGDAAAVTMTSAVSGSRWHFAVSRVGTFSGIALRDCDASGSVELSADAPSTDLGNNVNWRFNAAAARWVGSSDGYFTNSANWSTGIVPDEETRVIIDAAAKIKTDAEIPPRIRELRVVEGAALVVGGTQPLEIAEWLTVSGGGTAVLDTGVSASRAYICEGTLTHTGPHALNVTNRLALTVALDMEIDVLGKIDVSSKGWKGTIGLGNETPVNENYNARASHGGRGAMGAACYGSVFYPSSPGTGSRVQSALCGGGTVRLVVGGNLLVNGKILSGSSINADRGASGGSIWITAGSLSGSGRISAEGSYRLQHDWPGCGGRVAVYLTEAGSFDSFTGDINAYGGRFYDGVSFTYKPTSSCGTVYLQHALEADKCGTIVLDNDGGTSSGLGVELPAPTDGDGRADFANVKLVLRRGGALVLPSDLKVGDLVVEEEKAAIYLNDFRLKVGSSLHRDGLGWRGVTGKEEAAAYLDSIVNPGENSLGRILWPSRGFLMIVR